MDIGAKLLKNAGDVVKWFARNSEAAWGGGFEVLAVALL